MGARRVEDLHGGPSDDPVRAHRHHREFRAGIGGAEEHAVRAVGRDVGHLIREIGRAEVRQPAGARIDGKCRDGVRRRPERRVEKTPVGAHGERELIGSAWSGPGTTTFSIVVVFPLAGSRPRTWMVRSPALDTYATCMAVLLTGARIPTRLSPVQPRRTRVGFLARRRSRRFCVATASPIQHQHCAVEEIFDEEGGAERVSPATATARTATATMVPSFGRPGGWPSSPGARR